MTGDIVFFILFVGFIAAIIVTLVVLARRRKRQESAAERTTVFAADRFKKMRSIVRSWGTLILTSGVIGVLGSAVQFTSFLDGLVKIGAAVLGLILLEAPFLIVFGTLITFAGMWNLLYGRVYGYPFALLAGTIQLLLGIVVARRYSKFRHAHAQYNAYLVAQASPTLEDPVPERAPDLFPAASLGIGLVAALAMLVSVVSTILLVEVRPAIPKQLAVLDSLWQFGYSVAALGLGLGIASLTARHPRRWMVVAGTVLSATTILVVSAFILAFGG